MLDISISSNLAAITKRLTQLEQREFPRAAAAACTALAVELKDAELASMSTEIDRPSPFTRAGLVVSPATPTRLVAKLYMKDIQARYLEPLAFEDKRQRLGNSRAILSPVNAAKNAYGNLGKGTLARLKGRQNIFIGRVETRSGKIIDGAWERVELTAKGKTRRKAPRGSMWSAQHGRLRLLVMFTDPVKVRTTWHYADRARALVGRRFAPVFAAAMAKAMG